MNHPKSEKCEELGQLFLLIHESEPESRVQMMNPHWQLCGTTACHAGWFAIARNISRIDGDASTDRYDYNDSADDMAKFLGLENSQKLKEWADHNPDLWGNQIGYCLFSSREAFGFNDREPNLNDIGLHWLKVADRIRDFRLKSRNVQGSAGGSNG